jgi:hypothetical protein
MLEDMATSCHERIVSWQPHGEAFRVHLPEAFARTVMPRYFQQQKKYKSFLRQLYMYDFRRIGAGRDRGAYFHSMFIRNKKAMSMEMTRRQKIKGKNSSNPTNNYAPGDQPDFYALVTPLNVDDDQYQQGRCSLATSGLRSDPRMLQTCTTSKKKGLYSHVPGTMRCPNTSGSIDHHPDEEEEKPSLLSSAFLFDREVAGAAVPSPASRQPIDCEDIIDLAVDLLELRGVDEHNYDGDEGLFFGNRFLIVGETENNVDGRFQLAYNTSKGGGGGN